MSTDPSRPFWTSHLRPTKSMCVVAIFLLCTVSTTDAQEPPFNDWGSLTYTDHGVLQGVNSTGFPTFDPASFPIKMRGVVSNNYDEMLDNTANFIPFTGQHYQLGGTWQVFFQSVDPADLAGSCMWMGQNYGTTPEHEDDSASYSNEEWEAEIARLSWLVDPADPDPENPTLPLVQLREGCLVEVRARAGRHYAGKFNMNENHNNIPQNDFDIVLLDPDYGVPAPLEITLDEVMDAGGVFLFDETRQSGAELYQGRLVKLLSVTIVPDDEEEIKWQRYGKIIVSDGSREFQVHLGYNEAFQTASLPTGTLDITGVFDQEKFGPPLTSGYQMWATRPGGFLPAGSPSPGDANADGQVTDTDAAILATHWQASGAGWFGGDFNGDGLVNDADAAILATHWQEGVGEAAAVPEPGSAVLLVIAAAAMLLRCVLRSIRLGN